MPHKIAIVHTQRSFDEPDLNKMITHLEKELAFIDKVEVTRVTLAEDTQLPDCDQLVFCGYDNVTVAHLFLALGRGLRVTMYDEPGRSLQTELNNLLYRGVDSRRFPPSSLSAIEHSWSHRDIISVAKINASKLPSEPKSKPGNSTKTNRARQVENKRNSQAPEGNAPAGEESE